MEAMFFQQNNFNFHNTMLHVMATMGSFGLLSYVIYYVVRYAIFTKRSTKFNLFITFAFTLFEVFSLVQSTEFFLFPFLIYLTTMLAITEIENYNYRKREYLKEDFKLERQFTKL